ncbi:unnamed protein product [Pneumocystis jirovecii]|uniref:Phosphoglycerate mutase n=2 Tax=Pneumocystis jirovecii TaxID=42068 RepID=L0PFQ0_PNEJI|nr:uncharacterized protein T551_01964 [Pneumocystis jirovecii RU7]KTW30020.1 hypothetical protein T551_01964 [Pneumocystis jirovecii RU7]CCJ31231.1 unnamed protein product [Pneumocystis jirovecii]
MTNDKEIYIIRHAQAAHNKSKNYDLKDPELTEFGKDQAKLLLLHYDHLKELDLIISSPMRRAIETVLIGFDGFLSLKNSINIHHKSIPLIILPELQEISDRNCDTCSPLEDLQSQFPYLDFSLCVGNWHLKTGFFSYDPIMIEKRASWVRDWVSNRHERKIMLVSHMGFIKYLVDSSKPWANLEINKFTFDPGNIFKPVNF